MSHALVWLGNPGDVALNKRMAPVMVQRDKKPGHPRRGQPSATLVRRDSHAEAEADMAQAFARQWRGEKIRGFVTAKVDAYWPRRRHKGEGAGGPMGDCDAPLKAVGDALETAGVLHDDAQIRCYLATNHWDKAEPRIEVRLTRWEPGPAV